MAKGAGMRAGPVRGSIYARAISRVDYQPDICKDWKETGYCGYGDSCKFLHDRGDHKSGWEIDRDWEEQQKRKRARVMEGLTGHTFGPNTKKPEDDDDSDDDGEQMPIACFVCREPFKTPVKTKCGHFFCERCALKKCKRECVVCSKKTGGTFAMATKAERDKVCGI